MKNFLLTIKKIWFTPPLFIKVLIGLGLGILFGFLLPKAPVIGFMGDCFIFLLKALAPILVFFIITSSIGKSQRGVASRFALVICLYLITTFIAALLSVGASFIFQLKTTLKVGGEVTQTQTVFDILRNLFTDAFTNPVRSIADGNYIGILFWSILIGIALKLLKKDRLIEGFLGLSDAIGLIIHWIMELSPFGIMGLIFKAISANGPEIFVDYGFIILLLVSLMLIVLFATNPLFFFLVTFKNPYPPLFSCLRISGLQAFLTRSSAANIPNNLKVCDEYNVPKEFSSVSIPLGSVINMNGAAIAITCYTLIACFSVGVKVDIGSAIVLSIIATLAACGTSGVANGCLLLLPMSCALFNLTPQTSESLMAMAITLAVIVDCFETMLNSCSDAYFTIASDIAIKKFIKKHQKDGQQADNNIENANIKTEQILENDIEKTNKQDTSLDENIKVDDKN